MGGAESWVPRTTMGLNERGGALAGKDDGAGATEAMMDVGERAGEALDVGRSGAGGWNNYIIFACPGFDCSDQCMNYVNPHTFLLFLAPPLFFPPSRPSPAGLRLFSRSHPPLSTSCNAMMHLQPHVHFARSLSYTDLLRCCSLIDIAYD